MYGSLTFLPHSNFAVFDGWYFLQYCSQRAENCANCPNLSALSTFAFNSYIRPRRLWVELYANEEKCKQWRQQRFAYTKITNSIDNITRSASHSFIQAMNPRQGCRDNWVPEASVVTILLIESTLLSQSVTQSALFSTGYNWTGASYPRQVRTWRPWRQSADRFSTLRTRI